MEPIHTERLTILTWAMDDLEDAIRLWGDPDVMALINVKGALTRQETIERLNKEIETQERLGVQYWKTMKSDTKECIGCCGLRPYGPEQGVYEIGFHIIKRHWGNGYASEAAQGVIQRAFTKMNVPKLFAGHNPKNLASRTVLLKLGFKFIGDQFYTPTGLNHPSYELLNPQSKERI